MTVLTDNFTGGAQLTWVVVTGSTPSYASNQSSVAAANGWTTVRVDTPTTTADQDVSLKTIYSNVPADSTVICFNGPLVRAVVTADTFTGYIMNVDCYSSPFTAYVQRVINGSGETYWSESGITQTGWQGSTAASGHTLRLTVANEGGNVRLHAYIDGVECLNILDSEANRLTTGSYVGYSGWGDGSTVYTDVFVGQDLSGAPTTNAPAGLSTETRAALSPTVTTTGGGGGNTQAPAGLAAATGAARQPIPQGDVTFNHPGQIRAALQPTINAVSAPGQAPAGLPTTASHAALQPTISTGTASEGTHATGGALQVVSS